MGDFLRLFSLNGAHLVAGVFYGDFTVSKYGNIMGMKSNVTKDNHENGNIAEDIMGEKKTWKWRNWDILGYVPSKR